MYVFKKVNGITPVIAFEKEESSLMAEDERTSNATAEVTESVHGEVNSTSQPLSSSSVVADIVNVHEASSTSDGGNGNKAPNKMTLFARFAVANKGTSKTQNYANKSPYKLNV